MTEEMQKVYNADLLKFYKAFTGEDKIPLREDGKPTVTKFSDIKLREYQTHPECDSKGKYNKKYEGSIKDELFSKYVENIKKMITTAKTNQNKLLAIIDKLFVFVIDPSTSKKIITINPKLNDTSLQEIIEETRNIIVNLYITCETDFYKGIEIFRAIIAKQMKDTTESQIDYLKKMVSGDEHEEEKAEHEEEKAEHEEEKAEHEEEKAEHEEEKAEHEDKPEEGSPTELADKMLEGKPLVEDKLVVKLEDKLEDKSPTDIADAVLMDKKPDVPVVDEDVVITEAASEDPKPEAVVETEVIEAGEGEKKE